MKKEMPMRARIELEHLGINTEQVEYVKMDKFSITLRTKSGKKWEVRY